MNNQALEAATTALAHALADVLAALSEETQATPAPRLYTYGDLADMFHKSKETIRQWICVGEFGEPVKVGSSTRVTQEGLDKFLANHTGPTQRRASRSRPKQVRKNPSGEPLGI